MNRHSSPGPDATALRQARNPFKPLEQFLGVAAASGIVLLLATAVALVWANSPWAHTYEALWHTPLVFGVGRYTFTQSVHFWINDGLMAIFFLVVGLEIRRELHEGALSSVRQAALPLVAAAGGVVMPAIIYLAISTDPVLERGWAVPTATDIAFAVGVLAVLGKRVPIALRVLLLALAIIDDIAAILIIAIFYSDGVAVDGIAIAMAGMVLVIVFQRIGVRNAFAYVVPGAVVWIGMLKAGVHPALAGVVLGLMTPVRIWAEREGLIAAASRALDEFRLRGSGDHKELVQPLRQLQIAQRELLPPVVRVESALHPWVAFGIMPLFALANAGVDFEGLSLETPAESSVAAGIFFGLVLGKPIGICLASVLGCRLGACALPPGVSLRGLLVMGFLGGIGFTMSIFIAYLAFPDAQLLATAKFAVLAASTTAAALGLFAGWRFLKPLS